MFSAQRALLVDRRFRAMSVGECLGFAAALLQLQLGLGLVLAALRSVSRGPASELLAAVPWERALRAAGAAAGRAPLLAAFALVQARGAATNRPASAGLMLATASVLLGALLAVLAPLAERRAAESEGEGEGVVPERSRGERLLLAAGRCTRRSTARSRASRSSRWSPRRTRAAAAWRAPPRSSTSASRPASVAAQGSRCSAPRLWFSCTGPWSLASSAYWQVSSTSGSL